MTTIDSLYQRILDDPSDDGARLVYADAIEETDPKRAEYIRVQIELAKLKEPELKTIGRIDFGDERDVAWRSPYGGLCTRCQKEKCRYHELEDIEGKLFAANAKSWFGDFITFTNTHDPIIPKYIRRGFPYSVTLTLAAFLGSPCECTRANWEVNYVRPEVPVPERHLSFFEGTPIIFIESPQPPGSCCQHCHGSGRTPGLVKELAKWPIERVTLSDAVIHNSGGNSTVYLGGLGQFPQKYWRQLEGQPTRTALRDSISDACVRMIREARK